MRLTSVLVKNWRPLLNLSLYLKDDALVIFTVKMYLMTQKRDVFLFFFNLNDFGVTWMSSYMDSYIFSIFNFAVSKVQVILLIILGFNLIWIVGSIYNILLILFNKIFLLLSLSLSHTHIIHVYICSSTLMRYILIKIYQI